MGGVQSGAHNLGDALWVQERQKQKYQKDGNRHEDSKQESRKLLKRTRSLAVITEDDWRADRHSFVKSSEPNFDFYKKPQLIPRAKLIDRNSLKDRLSKSQQHLSDSYEASCHSQSICGLHSLSSFPDPLPCVTRATKPDPDRINIFYWPDSTPPPKRCCSVQNLDTVSGLVDIVEDAWPVEGNCGVDCIYTQVKRKRKEHRSLDSVLGENDNDLEYIDVLKLLPLSNVRLELSELEKKPKSNFALESSEESQFNQALNFALNEKTYLARERSKGSLPHEKNITDEEKSSKHAVNEDMDPPKASIWATKRKVVAEKTYFEHFEEAEETKSIWVSDSEDETEEIPQEKEEPLEIFREKEDESENFNAANARFFFENKSSDREASKNKQNEGRFERIVKETTNMLGKACNVVKGSLGFEIKTNSADSECEIACPRKSLEEFEDEKKNHTNLMRSLSCVDSMNCQEPGEPEFDHVRYKIVKSNIFEKNVYGNSGKSDVSYDGLMEYLKKYSFQELLSNNNVVIIEPVRAESMSYKSSSDNSWSLKRTRSSVNNSQLKSEETRDPKAGEKSFNKTSRQSSLRKHFFYQPIRVNRELIDDELPDPDTVRNVRQMFEATLGRKCESSDCNQKSSKDNDLESFQEPKKNYDSAGSDGSRSRSSENKTKTLAQSFEIRSGQTSPSETNPGKNRRRPGSASSGVSSDYTPFTSSEDETEAHDENDVHDEKAHRVSQDVLQKIRECGTSVTYYGGKVVQCFNGPLISPLLSGATFNRIDRDYVKFRLVKSNSCDSRLELAGRLIEPRVKTPMDIKQCTIAEIPSIEISSLHAEQKDEETEEEHKREPPVVIGSEPKKEESKFFRADFRLGRLPANSTASSRFTSALSKWHINENLWGKNEDFGKMQFEEFEVLEDSLNGNDNQTKAI